VERWKSELERERGELQRKRGERGRKKCCRDSRARGCEESWRQGRRDTEEELRGL
jgi:hypothetical protein